MVRKETEMRAERFTIKVREALETAQAAARSKNHQQITSAHLLQALLSQSGGVVRPVLQRLGANVEAIGGDLEADLPYGSKIRLGAEYLPEVSDWQGDYLIRAFADWTTPLLGWLDFKIAILNIYNNRPADDDTERNTFTTTAGLSFRF